MKLLRWGPPGAEKPGIVDKRGVARDLSAAVVDFSGAVLDPVALARLATLHLEDLPPVPVDARLGPCVAPGGKIVGVGLNYADHVREAGLEVPAEPVLFAKACRLSGPADPILIPAGAERVDWEIELAVVIGRETLHVSEDAAPRHIAGYAAFIDVSERGYQMQRGGQWIKGKSLPSFAPIGPWLVTQDDIPNPQDLALSLSVNGTRMQSSNTDQMLWGVMALVSYVSQFMALYPGDVLITGTPPGVGMGLTPPRYLKVGDTLHAAVAGLGEHVHHCVAATR